MLAFIITMSRSFSQLALIVLYKHFLSGQGPSAAAVTPGQKEKLIIRNIESTPMGVDIFDPSKIKNGNVFCAGMKIFLTSYNPRIYD